MKLILRYLVATIMVPLSIFVGIIGLIFHIFTAHRYYDRR